MEPRVCMCCMYLPYCMYSMAYVRYFNVPRAFGLLTALEPPIGHRAALCQAGLEMEQGKGKDMSESEPWDKDAGGDHAAAQGSSNRSNNIPNQ